MVMVFAGLTHKERMECIKESAKKVHWAGKDKAVARNKRDRERSQEWDGDGW